MWNNQRGRNGVAATLVAWADAKDTAAAAQNDAGKNSWPCTLGVGGQPGLARRVGPTAGRCDLQPFPGPAKRLEPFHNAVQFCPGTHRGGRHRGRVERLHAILMVHHHEQ